VLTERREPHDYWYVELAVITTRRDDEEGNFTFLVGPGGPFGFWGHELALLPQPLDIRSFSAGTYQVDKDFADGSERDILWVYSRVQSMYQYYNDTLRNTVPNGAAATDLYVYYPHSHGNRTLPKSNPTGSWCEIQLGDKNAEHGTADKTLVHEYSHYLAIIGGFHAPTNASYHGWHNLRHGPGYHSDEDARN